ncbi:MAG TPA: hypothetical protein VMQ54_06405 [Steroidobacteraceae bacterium]|jgi:hypothetical protein|nr:hypothetical protein [Steroidobacteraceae bacterium]
MTDPQGSRRRHARVISMTLFCMTAALTVRAADSAKPADEAYLDGLLGKWVMTGTLGGKPVHYAADGQRVLRGGFLELHMIDMTSPAQYEADAFIGFDPKANDYIAHWLDRFGAAGARVVARGERQGQRLVLNFPYAEGAFRDTFTWQPASDSWSLLMESQGNDGAWSTFARYTLSRNP